MNVGAIYDVNKLPKSIEQQTLDVLKQTLDVLKAILAETVRSHSQLWELLKLLENRNEQSTSRLQGRRK